LQGLQARAKHGRSRRQTMGKADEDRIESVLDAVGHRLVLAAVSPVGRPFGPPGPLAPVGVAAEAPRVAPRAAPKAALRVFRAADESAALPSAVESVKPERARGA
jgi:hypothetical protein